MIGQPMPTNILKYESKFVLGLTARKCGIYVIGLILGLLVFFKTSSIFTINTRALIAAMILIPFFIVGEANPYGENLEKILIPFIIDNFIAPSKRIKEIHFETYEEHSQIKKAKNKKDYAVKSKTYKMIR